MDDDLMEKIRAQLKKRADNDAKRLARFPEEHNSDTFIRCPACGWRRAPAEADVYECYAEGSHEVTCQSCGQVFHVTTAVTYCFSSPPALEVTRG